MGQKRMRYQWFQDVPRNVTRREYQRLQFLNVCAVGSGLLTAVLLITSVMGQTLQTSRELAEIEKLSIEDATQQGDRLELIQIEGFLVADQPLTMPDHQAQKAIRGQVKLSARPGTGETDADGEPLQPEILFQWNESVESVVLTDGDRRIPLAFDLAVLPMQQDPGPQTPRTQYAGESVRFRRPVSIQYGDQVYPLPDVWGEVERAYADLERQVLPQGQSVVVVAGLEPTDEGVRLVDPLGDRLQVLIGSEASIRQEGQRMRVLFFLLAFPLGYACFMASRAARALRQEFIERSNQS